jgi:hypothetical protein
MERNIRIALQGHSDSTLRVMGVGLAERFFGDHQHFAVARQFNGCAQAG